MSCEMCRMEHGWRGVTYGEPMAVCGNDMLALLAHYPGTDGGSLELYYSIDEMQVSASVPVRHCPWCGRKLDGEGE